MEGIKLYDYLTISKNKGFQPVTTSMLKEAFLKLGINDGDILMVHSSISSLGYVIGGVEALYESLISIVGNKGTIVVPSQTVEISDPSSWQYPTVPEEWFEEIRRDLPPFDKKRSFSKSMGQFSIFLGQLPTSCRSNHPMYSFTAIGHYAKEITENQQLDFPFGDHSPLSKMYDLNAKILMIGTDFETNTAIHLAEHSLDREIIIEKSKIQKNGVSKWVEFKNIDLDIYDDYLQIEKLFFDTHSSRTLKINESKITCFSLMDCVEFTKKYYIERHEK